jgi:peroxiredoxin
MTDGTSSTRKTKHQSLILISMIIIGVGVIVLLQMKDTPYGINKKPRLQKGALAPDFSFPDLDGKMVNLSDFRGQIVFLNIWATWCPPCVDEMPSMEKLHQVMANEKFQILAVSVDTDGKKAVKPFVERYKLSFPILTDIKGTIRALYQTTGIPETIIIDKNGIVIEKVIGPRDWASTQFINVFQDLLNN